MEARAYEQFLTLERDHWWFRGRRSVYLGLLRHHLGGRRPKRVLDLGCGFGGFLAGLSELGAPVVHTESAADGLVRCRERGFPLGVLAEARALPFAESSFDVICLFDVIEHLDDDSGAVAEVARVLEPGGIALFTVPAYPWLYANNDRVAHHRRRYTRKMLRRLFAESGLVEERNTHANALLFPLIAPAVLALKACEGLVDRRGGSDHTNLSLPLPRWTHDLLHAVFAAELPLSRRFDLPAGHSIAAIARRPSEQV